MTSPKLPPMTSVKAWVAALGVTLTAISTAVAAVQVALSDGSLDGGDVASIITAVVVASGAIYGVWRAPNKVKDGGTPAEMTVQKRLY